MHIKLASLYFLHIICITVRIIHHWSECTSVHLQHIHWAKKATIHQATAMLATSKNVLFPGHNDLLTTGTDDLTLWLSPKHQLAYFWIWDHLDCLAINLTISTTITWITFLDTIEHSNTKQQRSREIKHSVMFVHVLCSLSYFFLSFSFYPVSPPEKKACRTITNESPLLVSLLRGINAAD